MHFYNNCKYLKWLYPKSTYIGNSHSKVIAYCKLFRVDVYKIKKNDGMPICCISHSPYAQKNCAHFNDKNNQTQLNQFIL